MDGVQLGEAGEQSESVPRGFEAAAGAVVGSRWILREELGRGASSIVWRATHELLGKDVAIKFLDPRAVQSSGSTRENVLERFRFEAQVSSTLATRTAEIVAVHDAGVFADLPFIVMDLVRGDSVASLIERDAMTLELTVRMVRDIATALDACHDEGIAHRDTKPANILLVTSTGAFKLTDFGLAKHFGPVPAGAFVPRNTEGAMLVGTPAYMGPEAISAERMACGRGDVWSLAVTLYECITRTLPFDGEAWPAVAVAIMNRSFITPSAHREAFAHFDAFFARAFAEDIAHRFQNARELAEAFERAASPIAPIEPEPVKKSESAATEIASSTLRAADPPDPEARPKGHGTALPTEPGQSSLVEHTIDLEIAAPPPMRRSLLLPLVLVLGLGATTVAGFVLFGGRARPAQEAARSSVAAASQLPSSEPAAIPGSTSTTTATASLGQRPSAIDLPSPVPGIATMASPRAVVTTLVNAAATTTVATTATTAESTAVTKPPSKAPSPSEVW